MTSKFHCQGTRVSFTHTCFPPVQLTIRYHRPHHLPQPSRVVSVEEKTKQSAVLEQDKKKEETQTAALEKSTVANMASSVEVC